MLEPMRDLSDFLPLVIPYAPGVSDPMAIQALRLSAAEYCRRTRCWRHTSQVEITQDNAELIVAPANTSVFEIETSHWGTGMTPLTPITYTDIDPLWLTTDPQDLPRYVTMVTTNAVTVVPRAEGTLHLSMFLTPITGPTDTLGAVDDVAEDVRLTVNKVPEFLFNDVAEVIAAGALFRLKMTPNQEFSDPNGAAVFKSLFDDATDTRFRTGIKGKHGATKRAPTLWM